MKRKNDALSFTIGALIGTVLAVYATNQQGIYAEEHRRDLKPVAEVRVIELNTVETEPEAVEVEPEVEEAEYFDVPLSHELQDFIFAECEKHNIAPAIVVSMIEQESKYAPSAIGDDGESTGLMQIQKKWHEERMDKLGCTDLLNPFENVAVGIDYLAELKEGNKPLYWVLMAYNGGRAYADRKDDSGSYSKYAIEVADRAAKMEGGEYSWN